MSDSSFIAVNQLIDTLSSCVNENEEINWFQFWNQCEIEIIPNDYDINAPTQNIISELPKIIESIFKRETDERIWIIVQRRLGLGGASTLTLEELGIAFGLTRERVRQIEAKAISNLNEILLENCYIGKQYHVHPIITAVIQDLSNFIKLLTNNPILETELFSTIHQNFEIDIDSLRPSFYLLLTLNDVEQIRFRKSNLDAVWGTFTKTQARKLVKIVETIDVFLTEDSSLPMSEIDILIEVNKTLKGKNRITLDDLRKYMQICNSIEIHSNGFYWSKFEHLSGRGNQVERILLEQGEPIHFAEITREINHRLTLHGKKTVTKRNLGNQISTQDRFVPIGKSGEWGLSSWSIDTNTIVDLMKESLITRNEPATSNDIYAYVKERRPVRKSSIDSYLIFRDEFAKVDRIRWGLKAWSEVKNAVLWTPIEVGQFIERLFRKHRTRKLPYHLLKQSLMEATNFTERQVQGLLIVNPIINTKREKDSKELFAYFQTDYIERLDTVGAGFKRKKKTLRQKVDEFVKDALENAPGQQIALSDLVDHLIKEFNRIDKTFYHYISDLDYVEKFTIPDTNIKMCRMRRVQKAFPFSQVEDIQTLDLKTKIGRALTFLNEADVDISLFLLSKEFEATLKSYLEMAHVNGVINNLPSGRLSLQSMVDFVGRENIISDKAILHFLRQKRNDRAHGTMPSHDERQVMMKHAETTAGMYIDYIKFFDDLTHALG